jgi:hypothetical protein
MGFWNVNEMIELFYGMPVPQFGGRIFVSARIRAGSRSKRFLCFVLVDVRCLRIPHVEDHCSVEPSSPFILSQQKTISLAQFLKVLIRY